MISGIIAYNDYFQGLNPLLGVAHLVLYGGFWIICECCYQYKKRRNVVFTSDLKMMSTKEFQNRIEKGEKLVILDDLVLDVTNYAT